MLKPIDPKAIDQNVFSLIGGRPCIRARRKSL